MVREETAKGPEEEGESGLKSLKKKESKEKKVSRVFPLGEKPQREKEIIPKGEGIASPVTRESKESPSEKKEDIMDEETKKFIGQQLSGLREDFVKRVEKSSEENREEISKLSEAITALKGRGIRAPSEGGESPEGKTKKSAVGVEEILAKIPKAEEIVDKVKESLREDEERKAQDVEERERLKRVDEALALIERCKDDPDLRECKTLPEIVEKIADRRLSAKLEEMGKKVPKKKEEEPEAELPKKKYADMTPEEQAMVRGAIETEGYPHTALVDILVGCHKSGKKEACNLISKLWGNFTPEEIFTGAPEEKSQALAEVVCIDDVCKPVRDWLREKKGIAMLKKTDKGWEAVDKEVEEELDKETEKKVKEEVEKKPHF